MAEVIQQDNEFASHKTKDAITSGKIVIYPTDTVYGIGCDALNATSVEQIKKKKAAMRTNRCQLYLERWIWYASTAKFRTNRQRFLQHIFPDRSRSFCGSKRKGKTLEQVSGSGGRIGIRVPEHQLMRRISSGLGVPVVTTSANPSGEKEVIEFGKINKKLFPHAILRLMAEKRNMLLLRQ